MPHPRIARAFVLASLAALSAAIAACHAPAPVTRAESPVEIPVQGLPPSLPPAAPPAAAVRQAPAAQAVTADAIASRSPPPRTRAKLMEAEAYHGHYAPPVPPPEDRETYDHRADNTVQRVAEHPVSTFSVDVDTGSYSNTRRLLNEGRLPPADAVRVEEFINYFTYPDAAPTGTDAPFAVHTELAPSPWNAKTRLLRIGVQGYRPSGPLPPSNLVFLVDVSGSMNAPDKLPLVKNSLKLLVRQLRAQDRISLVTYAGATRVVLEPTPGDQHAAIEQAIDRLDASGSTAGAAGIQLAYQQAEKAFLRPGNNRVLLATDGDFNVGITRFESVLDLIRQKRQTGIALTTLGYGTGNYNEHLMEQAADAGNGNYAYIDSLQEAQKVLVAQQAATLLTIARDVKIQVEFNPAAVAEYRLIGYENRALQREDFTNDRVDAGEIGAGHHVTALYELALVGDGGERHEPLRYGAPVAPRGTAAELAHVRLRYQRPGTTEASRLIEHPVRLSSTRPQLAQASDALRLSAAVAAFGQKLKGGRYLEGMGFAAIAELARGARGADASGSVGEFERLVQLASSLSAASAVPEASAE